MISALMLLTRLPVRGRPTDPAARAAWAWPLVGLPIGGAVTLVLLGATAAGLGTGIAAALALATGIALTGALHEDGLADVADGFWGGFTPARRLEIMRDSRIGSYGTIALILSLLARWSLLVAVATQGLWWAPVAAAMASRAAMAVHMRMLPPARMDGLSHGAGTPRRNATIIAVAFGAAALLPFGSDAVVSLGLLGVLMLAFARLCRAKIGGQTGDTCGTTQQLSEIAVLAVLTSG
ncbi:adenosylcobinamide-GDP ribazoletransferase [Jannaschia aquimarina]|nr:adenosylcobinamide-GDP ribazoletransferase [Jannaschia aquimarina]